MFQRKKLGWAIALALSVMYLVILFLGDKPPCDYSSRGFCVTNYDKEKGVCPRGDNSHYWCWLEAVVYTILAVVVGIATKADQSTILSFTAIILSHGLLHKVLDSLECKAIHIDGNRYLIIIAITIYFSFIVLISWVATGLAGLSNQLKIIISVFVAAVTLFLSQPEQNNGFSSIFMTTQLLVSGLGFFCDSAFYSKLLGDLFILPCAVSILELIFCCKDSAKDVGFFNKIGGHAWYDFFLNAAILSVYFPEKKSVTKEECDNVIWWFRLQQSIEKIVILKTVMYAPVISKWSDFYDRYSMINLCL